MKFPLLLKTDIIALKERLTWIANASLVKEEHVSK
jgi:hypothetical protein